MKISLRVCTCAQGKIASEHTIDIHDEKTGECRSITDGRQCSCRYFVDSGRTVIVEYE